MVLCSQLQHYQEDLVISFIPAGCCFPASHLSLEYFSVSAIRYNKAFSKISVDIVSTAKSSGDLEGKGDETKLDLQIVCEMDAHILTFLLSLLPPENFQWCPTLVHPAPFALVCECNCMKSARKNKPIFPHQKAACPSVARIPAKHENLCHLSCHREKQRQKGGRKMPSSVQEQSLEWL